MSGSAVAGEFVTGTKGPIFVLLRRPAAPVRGCVLVVPPFAEEMNKCRRMVTELALALAEQGIATVVPDLYGTGDSAGDFADADWSTWQDDLIAAAEWSKSRGCPVTGVLAIRLGAALTTPVASHPALAAVTRTALWQPVFDGNRFLTQFLRLRTAASLMDDRKETVADLRTQLNSGAAIEIAGYSLPSRLAGDLDAIVTPDRLPAASGELGWFEVVRDAESPLPAPSVKLIEQTRTQGGTVHAAGIPGEPYWSSTEIVVNQAVVTATLSHFRGRGQGEGC